MITPYGSDKIDARYVSDPSAQEALAKEAAELPQVVVSSAAAANCVMSAVATSIRSRA